MRKNIISILLLTGAWAHSQTANELRSSFVNNIKSPQVTDFMRYGNIPIKQYIGELDLNIPLLSVPTQDGNNIDISLAYNASGFIPSKKSGIVGFNWNIMAGGVVTREVRGEADDQLGSPQTLNGIYGRYEHGYLAGIRQFGTNVDLLPTDNDISTFNTNKLTTALDNLDDKFYEVRLKGYPDNFSTRYETTPDMFSFNFNGISGKFFIAPNGGVEVITTEPHKLKIDLSGVSSQPYVSICSPRNQSEIIITDEAGNKYYFGKESKNLEYTVFLGNSANGSANVLPIINSWYLYKTEFLNGETIKYNYLNDKINIDGNSGSSFCYRELSGVWHGSPAQYVEMKKLLDFNVHVNDYSEQVNTDQQSWGMSYTHYTATYGNGYGNLFSMVKKTLLSDIEYKKTKIKFTYSDQENLYKNTQVVDGNNLETPFRKVLQKKLDKIELFHENNLVNDINLTYDIYNTQYPRIFLKTIKEKEKNPYIFSYETSNSANTPKPSTCALDYWGFYNGKLTNDPYFSYPKLVPEIKYYNNGDFEYISDVREPSFDFAKMYSLLSVTYPTGGSSFFEYEPHQYSLRLERRSDNSFIPKLYNVNSTGGGTRIKKIYDQDSTTNQNVREFFYTNDDNQSSGILMDWPRYYFKLRRQITNTAVFPLSVDETIGYTASSGYSKNLFEGALMNYSKVIEKVTNKGSIVDYYTSYINKPDRYVNSYNQSSQLTDGTYTPVPSVRNIFMMPYDTNVERGKVYKKMIKDEANNLLEETNILYNEDSQRFNKHHVSINISNAWRQPIHTYYYNDFISSSITKKYFGNNVLQTESKYFYENPNHNMLTKIYTSSTDESVQKTLYKYAHEKSNQLMIDKNMIGVPLETETTQTIGSLDTILSKIETIYPIGLPTSQTGNLVLPLSIKSYDIQNPTVSSTEATYDKYDSKGNLLQYTTKDGISTVIIWGYNGTQPIAKITGAAYAQVSSLASTILTASDTDAAAAANNDETSFLSLLDNFRKEYTLANYQITTYTYDPLIGVRSITPPSGIREVYLYDTANRLKEIRQDNAAGKIIKEFKYNYKQ